MPRISVILPVYNCQEYIFEAVKSILNQTFSDFEFIIIDDCSTDTTLQVIKNFNDARIIIIEKPVNTGYTDSLNYAISIAKGQYIARMDGDDISFPTRFEKQVAFLEANDDVILCGSGIQIIGTEVKLNHPTNHDEILVKLCFGNSFYHPTIMARKNIMLSNNYDKKFEPAEDYDLWTRLAFVGKLANIPEVLLNYREHDSQISNIKNETQLNNAFLCKLEMLNRLNISNQFTDFEIKNTIEIQNKYFKSDLKIALNIFNFLKLENQKRKVFKIAIFESKLAKNRIDYLKRFFNYGNKFGNFLFLIFKISALDLLQVIDLKKRVFNFKN